MRLQLYGRVERVAQRQPGAEGVVGPFVRDLPWWHWWGDVVIEDLADDFAGKRSPDWGHGYEAGGIIFFILNIFMIRAFSVEMVGVVGFHGLGLVVH